MRRRKYVRRAGITETHPRRGLVLRLVDANPEGLETIKYGHEEIQVYPKFCEKTPYYDCLQCSLTGMKPCAPRFRDVVRV